MALSPDLVARAHRPIADSGPPPGLTPLTDADYERLVDELLAHAPHNEELRLFVYGSLIWKPACAIDGQMPGLLRAWHRKFCLRVARFRGTADRPGLMMSLDHGGACRGMIQRLCGKDAPDRLHQLMRRELSVRPFSHRPIWVDVETGDGRKRAIAFVINRKGPSYAGDHDLEETARILASACGHWGSGAEYLMHTVRHLEQLDIHDRYLWSATHGEETGGRS
jgi:cation transport protein ChaC